MRLKKYLLGVIIAVFYVVLFLTNYVFIHSYVTTYETLIHGERVSVKAVELLRKPGGGYRGYRYKVDLDQEIREVFIKSKLDLNISTKVIISPSDSRRIFQFNNDDGFLTIYNGLTGGWFISILVVFIHSFILKVTWIACIKIPLEFIRTVKLTRR
jgi:hypothetical protein